MDIALRRVIVPRDPQGLHDPRYRCSERSALAKTWHAFVIPQPRRFRPVFFYIQLYWSAPEVCLFIQTTQIVCELILQALRDPVADVPEDGHGLCYGPLQHT